MAKKKTHKNSLGIFGKVWFSNETEYFIFLIWGTFVIVLLFSFIGL